MFSGNEFHTGAPSDLKLLFPNFIVSGINLKIIFSVRFGE